MKNVASSNALVSICIPVYNGSKYIRETVSTVLKQTYRPIEIVIQDNASTDDTWQILEQLTSEHPEISIARNAKNVGMAGNWNIAVQRAHGEYISLLSADDLMLDQFVERCIECFAEHQVSIVTTNHYWLRGEELAARKMRSRSGLHRNFAAMVMLFNPFSINFSMFTRQFVNDCYDEGPMFREDVFTCDYDLWLKVALAGRAVYYISEPLGAYRVHSESLSTQTRRMQRQTEFVLTSHRKNYKGFVKVAYLLTLIRFLLRAYRTENKQVDRKLVRALLLAMRATYFSNDVKGETAGAELHG